MPGILAGILAEVAVIVNHVDMTILFFFFLSGPFLITIKTNKNVLLKFACKLMRY